MTNSILAEAQEVIADRRARVDGPEGNFERIAQVWSVVFGHPVTAREVALCMIGLKFARECYGHWRDNLVDLCGYADCLALIEGDYNAPADDSGLEACDPQAQARIKELTNHLTNLKAQPLPEAFTQSQPGRWRPFWEAPGRYGSRDGVPRNEEGDGGSGQVDALCACSKTERDCNWPDCSAHITGSAAVARDA